LFREEGRHKKLTEIAPAAWTSVAAKVCDPIFARNAALDSRLINQRAAEGWELTAVGGTNYYFKRAR